MTRIEALLYRMGDAQRANDFKPVDGFACEYDEAGLVDELYLKSWIRLARRQDLLDAVLFNNVALTRAGVQEWMRLHRMRADPSGK